MKRIFIMGLCALTTFVAIWLMQIADQSKVATPAVEKTAVKKSSITTVAPPEATTKSNPEIKSVAEEIEQLKTICQNSNAANGLPPELRAHWANRLKTDPAFVLAAIAYAQSETNLDSAKLSAHLIAENSDAASRQSLQDAALKNAHAGESPENRIAALAILTEVSLVQPDAIKSLSQVAQSDVDPIVRLSAMETLDTWSHHSVEMESQVTAEFIQIIKASASDPQTRARGYQAMAMQNIWFSKETLQSFADLVPTETSHDNLNLAAAVFSMAADDGKEFALGQLEALYLRETDAAGKREVANKMVSLGRGNALERIKQISANDPAFIQQMQDYLSTLQ